MGIAELADAPTPRVIVLGPLYISWGVHIASCPYCTAMYLLLSKGACYRNSRCSGTPSTNQNRQKLGSFDQKLKGIHSLLHCFFSKC